MKSYITSPDAVNPALFLSDPPIEAFAHCKATVALRLARAGVDFEKYRSLIENRVHTARLQQQREKLKDQKTDSSLFASKDLALGDPSRVRLVKSSAGRPALDPVLMFRVVFLGQVTQQSDADMSLKIMGTAKYYLPRSKAS